jgi:hypothetical protein
MIIIICSCSVVALLTLALILWCCCCKKGKKTADAVKPAQKVKAEVKESNNIRHQKPEVKESNDNRHQKPKSTVIERDGSPRNTEPAYADYASESFETIDFPMVAAGAPQAHFQVAMEKPTHHPSKYAKKISESFATTRVSFDETHQKIEQLNQIEFVEVMQQSSAEDWSSLSSTALTGIQNRIMEPSSNWSSAERATLALSLGAVGKETEAELATRPAFLFLREAALEEIGSTKSKKNNEYAELENVVHAMGRRTKFPTTTPGDAPAENEYFGRMQRKMIKHGLKPIKLGMTLEFEEGRDEEMMKSQTPTSCLALSALTRA